MERKLLFDRYCKMGTPATKVDMKELNGAIESIHLVDLLTKIRKEMLKYSQN